MVEFVICGIGNRMRGDDAVGPAVIDALKGRTNARLVDCGSAPESFLGHIEKLRPENVIIIDAVDMKKRPGMIALIDVNKIKGKVMSTHNIPMTLFLEYLQERIRPKVTFIGVQPKQTGLDEKMSRPCAAAVPKIADKITKLLNRKEDL